MKAGFFLQATALLSVMAVVSALPSAKRNVDSVSVAEWDGGGDMAPDKRNVDSVSVAEWDGGGDMAPDKRNVDSVSVAEWDGGGDMAPDKRSL
ncbi:hypothetical protein ZTR_06051 [Talaromyces verruculosus]|nr:hypothetical protein ZTR_06051 [Talaromyces verruculosus]